MILPPVKQENPLDKLAYFLTGAVSIVAAAFYFSDEKQDNKNEPAKFGSTETKTNEGSTKESKSDPQNQIHQANQAKEQNPDLPKLSESEQSAETEAMVNPS